tara:strand:+ start:387 stop:1628 length:1242 start_codon:yes stop_codon:yes gene_type:complete
MATSSTTVTGRLLDAKGVALANEYIKFRVKSVGVDDDVTPKETFPKGPVDVQADGNGDFTTPLWVNGESDVSCLYEIIFPDGQRIDVIIPTSASGGTIDIATLIALHQPDASTQQSTVLAQAIDRTNHTGGPDDLAGEKIILDADGDTSITADTDDRIDFEIGGADVLTLTAAKATILDSVSQGGSTATAAIGAADLDQTNTFTGNRNTVRGSGLGVWDANLTGRSLLCLGGEADQDEAWELSAVAEGSFQIMDFDGSGSTFILAANGNISVGSSGEVTPTEFGRLSGTSGLLYSTGGTDVSVADGGTGASTVGAAKQSLQVPTTTITATTYTALVTDSTILVNESAPTTITLPAAATAGDGFELVIMKIGSSSDVVIDGNGSETINGATTQTLTTQYSNAKITTNGTAWFII